MRKGRPGPTSRIVLGTVTPRRVDEGQSPCQFLDCFKTGPSGVLQFEPRVADLRQTFFPIPHDEHVDEPGHRFRILHARAAGDHQRHREVAFFRRKRNSAQVQNREHVGVAEVVLQRETEHVEVCQRCECFEAVERQALRPQQGFHVGPGGVDPFAGPVVAPVHGRIEHLHPVVAHADRVGIGKGQADLAPDRPMVLSDGVQLTAQVLAGSLNEGQESPNHVILQSFVEHEALSRQKPAAYSLQPPPDISASPELPEIQPPPSVAFNHVLWHFPPDRNRAAPRTG